MTEPLTVHVLSSNEDLQARILEAIATQQAQDPFHPVTLISSGAAQGWELRRQLMTRFPVGTGVANIRVMALGEFMEACRQSVLPGAAPLDRMVRTVAVERLLAQEQGALAAAAHHPDTAQLLTRLADSLAWCALEPEQLTLAPVVATHTAAACLGFVQRMRDELTGTMAVPNWPALNAAVQVASPAALHDLVARLGTIVWACPLLPASAAGVLAVLRAAGCQVHRVHVHPQVDAVAAREVVSCPDPITEVAIAVREVAAKLRAGVAPERIAILYSTPTPYAALLERELASANFQWRGPAADTLEALALPRLAMLFSDMAERRVDGASGITRRSLMRWLALAAITLDGTYIRPSRLREFVRERNLHGDATKWLPMLTAIAASAANNSADEELSAQEQRKIESAADLLRLVTELDACIASIASAKTWAEAGAALHAALDTFHDGLTPKSADEDERSATAMVSSLLRISLPRLDALPSQSPPAAEMRRLLERQFVGRRTRHGRSSVGVHVGPVTSAQALAFDHIIIVGANEGSLLQTRGIDALMPDALREHLRADVDDLRTAAESGALDRGTLFGVTAAAHDVLGTFSRTGVDGCSEGHLSPLLSGPERYVTSGGSEQRTTPAPATPLDIALRSSTQDGRVPEELESQLRAAAAWNRPSVGPTFGRVDAADVASIPGLDGTTISASAIETHQCCPYQYFVRRVLHVRTDEVRDDIDEIAAKDFGTMLHSALEAFVKAARDAGLLPAPGGEWPAGAAELLRAEILREVALAKQQGQVGWLPAWNRKEAQVLDSIPRYLQDDALMRAGLGLNVGETEVAFGEPGTPAVTVTLDDGTTVNLRGRMDRLDVCPDGSVRGVVDYKSGKLETFTEDLGLDEFGRRHKVQDLVYDQAVQAMHPEAATRQVAFVFFPNAGEPAHFPIDASLLPVTVSTILESMHADISAGVFPLSGEAFPHCPVCKVLGRRAALLSGVVGADE